MNGMPTHCSPEVLRAAAPCRVDEACGKFIEATYDNGRARFGRAFYDQLVAHPRLRCAKCGVPFDLAYFDSGKGAIVIKGPAGLGETEAWPLNRDAYHAECLR